MSKRQQDAERRRLFVVRLWPESFDYGRRVWRGEVVDTGTDTRRYFARWEDLLGFLCKAIGASEDESVASEITTEVMAEESDRDEDEPVN